MKFTSSASLFVLSSLFVEKSKSCPFLSGTIAETVGGGSTIPDHYGRELQNRGGDRENNNRIGEANGDGAGETFEFGGSGGGRFGDSGDRDFQCNFQASSAAEAINAVRENVASFMNENQRRGPQFVRLAFHDCVGPLGCNGSINMTNLDNAGLGRPISILEPLVDCYDVFLTRADIWAFAALEAAQLMQPSGGPQYNFDFVGRSSMNDPREGGNEQMPGNHWTTDQVLEFFLVEFGFSADETVAIMGAHTLGSLSRGNSGFEGRWVRNQFSLDNEFFEVLLDNEGLDPDARFVQEIQNGQYIWRRGGDRDGNRDGDNEIRLRRKLQQGGGGGGHGGGQGGGDRGDGGREGGGRGGGGALRMLNADMALVSDMDGFLDPNTGFARCVPTVQAGDTLSQCPSAPTLLKVQEYARNPEQFLVDFRNAMEAMVNQDSDNLTAVLLSDVQGNTFAASSSSSPIDGEEESSSFQSILIPGNGQPWWILIWLSLGCLICAWRSWLRSKRDDHTEMVHTK